MRSISISNKGQAWSIDVMMAVLFFTLAVLIFFSLLSTPRTDNSMSEDAKHLTETITSRIIQDNEISEEKFKELADKPYQNLKSELGIESDFCIFIEDENGNLITITDPDNPPDRYTSIGNPDTNLELDTPQTISCGDKLT